MAFCFRESVLSTKLKLEEIPTTLSPLSLHFWWGIAQNNQQNKTLNGVFGLLPEESVKKKKQKKHQFWWRRKSGHSAQGIQRIWTKAQSLRVILCMGAKLPLWAGLLDVWCELHLQTKPEKWKITGLDGQHESGHQFPSIVQEGFHNYCPTSWTAVEDRWMTAVPRRKVSGEQVERIALTQTSAFYFCLAANVSQVQLCSLKHRPALMSHKRTASPFSFCWTT